MFVYLKYSSHETLCVQLWSRLKEVSKSDKVWKKSFVEQQGYGEQTLYDSGEFTGS